ncbi:MAG: hypothetical protein COZ27_02775 [Candidatus Moranbacteria bacterium CG_4_10_14_3_um_filter_41_65]|nr:MAG: hypothetical protein COW50_03405 [Candidatus Moranbacteria bacterium CG17_big_fil_post_rev_8_21_14_2_50_41_107]PIX91428.1 MAG: hypothetical protein COZ27_02775 [Candidatus Moranbacteria bacterium CG_4_10_14_3_um_filter_41_65]
MPSRENLPCGDMFLLILFQGGRNVGLSLLYAHCIRHSPFWQVLSLAYSLLTKRRDWQKAWALHTEIKF